MKGNNTPIYLVVFCMAMFAVLTQACTGYSDGPNLSLRSTAKKIGRTWRVKQAVKNNVEVTETYKSGFFSFTEEGAFTTVDTKRDIIIPPYTQPQAISVLGDGSWQTLSNTKLELLYTYTFSDPYNPNVRYSDEAYEQWDILRLTEGEFWIKNDSMSFKLIAQ
ncbi:MAG: hypothetical protein ACKVTZ_14150 [Bacteroidia bacterium]